MRASECALRVRVKSLTNELALLRRGLDNLSVYFIFTFYLFIYFLQTILLISECYFLWAHVLSVFLQQIDACVRSHQLSGRWRRLSLSFLWKEVRLQTSQGSIGVQRTYRAQISGEGKKSRLLRTAGSHTQTLTFSHKYERRSTYILLFKMLQKSQRSLSPKGPEQHALTPRLTSRTGSADWKRQNSKSQFPFFFSFSFFIILWMNNLYPNFCQTAEGEERHADVPHHTWERPLSFQRGLSSAGPRRQQRQEFVYGAPRQQELLRELISRYGRNGQNALQVRFYPQALEGSFICFNVVLSCFPPMCRGNKQNYYNGPNVVSHLRYFGFLLLSVAP